MRDRLRRLSSDSDRIELDRNLGASVQEPKKAGRSGVTQPCYLSDVAKCSPKLLSKCRRDVARIRLCRRRCLHVFQSVLCSLRALGIWFRGPRARLVLGEAPDVLLPCARGGGVRALALWDVGRRTRQREGSARCPPSSRDVMLVGPGRVSRVSSETSMDRMVAIGTSRGYDADSAAEKAQHAWPKTCE